MLDRAQQPEPPRAEMAARDILSATEALLELPPNLLWTEIDNIELAHARLSKVISRVYNGKTI